MSSTASGEGSRSGRPTSTEAARLTDRLRRAAMDTFLEHGYDGTTMEAVAQAAGITKSTLYGRYADKRALFIAVSAWALTRHERHERVLEPLPDDLAAALTVIARAILARSVDPDLVRLNRMAIAEAHRFPEFAASTQAVSWSPRIQMIIDLLRRHHDAGAITIGDIELAAEQFFAMVGAMPAWLAAHGVHRTPEDEDKHLRHAIDLFLNGLLIREAADLPPRVTGGAEERPPGASGEIRRRARAASEPLPRRRVGRSGLQVSPLGLGTRYFGTGQGCDERTAARLVHRYLDAGGNLIAAVDAVSEETCGRILRGRRPDVVLAARAATPGDGGTNGRRHIRAACEAALRRLQTDHIDLYQVHFGTLDTPLEETMDALDGLVRAGKVLYLGASGIPAYRLMKALSVSDRRAGTRFVSLHAPYGLTARGLEHEHLPLLEDEGLGLIGESIPVAGTSAIDTGEGAIIPAMRQAASELGCTMAQLALAWQQAGPVASTLDHPRGLPDLKDALAAMSIEIPGEMAARLERISRPTDRDPQASSSRN
ncbi:aldo/keto reductase [Spirillospora sp. CA-255316]